VSALSIKGLVALAFLGYMVRNGYARRRLVWSRRSWQLFALTLAAIVALIMMAMAMASGVDNGVYRGMTPLAHRLYFVTLMALAVVSPIALVGLITWFARGNPERQFAPPWRRQTDHAA
jgi:hypothetical protein